MFTIHQRQDTWPSEAELHELLSVICTGFEKVYIILDGLDEAQEDVKIQLLEEINTLPSNTRTLIMSRPLKTFEYLVRGVAGINIEARNEDIELFVEKKIAQMPRLHAMLAGKDGEKHRICKAIKEKSGGMFLVASLQLEALKGSMTPRALMNALETLPTTINDLYRHTLKRIDSQSEEEVLLAKRAILWLVYALGPLQMNELRHALATNPDLGIYDEDDIVPGEFIFDVCCGLVSTSYDHDFGFKALRLIHYTAHDFLKEVCLSWFPAPHTFLSSICVVYLSAQLRYLDYPNEWDAFNYANLEDPFVMSDSLRPFLIYASHHWGTHARLSVQEKGLSPHVSQFVSRPLPYPWRHGFYFDELGPHQLAAVHGLTDLLKAMSPKCGVTPKQQFTLLHLAAIGGHVDSAKIVLERWPEMSARDTNLDGQTPLMLASAFGHEEMVKLLLSIDPGDIETLNARAACGCTALASAIRRGHTKIVQILASHQGVRLDVQTCTRSPLSWAAAEGHLSLVRQLLSNPDIEVNAQHPFTGYTALCYASRLGHPEAVEALLTRKEVDIHLGPICGCTPLLIAATTNQLSIVALLLSNPNINVHARCTHSGTALSAAKDEAISKLLLSHERILFNATANDIHLCLTLAARLGLKDTFSRLVHGGLEPARLQMQSTALIEAARHGHTAIVEVALRFVEINAEDDVGWTALNAAADAGHKHTISLLLSHKALVVHKPRSFKWLNWTKIPDFPNLALEPQTSLSVALAAERKHHDVVDALLSGMMHDYRDSATLIAACRSGRDAVVRGLLLQPDINVNVEDEHGWTPLAHAAWNNHQSICRVLLAHPEIQPCAGKACPLVRAAFRGCNEIVQMLLQPIYRVDANATEEGWSLLAAATYSGSAPIVEALLARDDVDVNLGRPAPLIVAVWKGHTAIVRTLLAHKHTDVNIWDSKGQYQLCKPTALFFACQRGPPEVVQALLRHPDINISVRLSRGSAHAGHPTPVSLPDVYYPFPSFDERFHYPYFPPVIDSKIHIAYTYTSGDYPFQSLEGLWSSDSPPFFNPEINTTPLHVATGAEDWQKILPLLLEVKDLDPNTLNERGESALALMLDKGAGEIAPFPGVFNLMTSIFLASPDAIRNDPALLRRAARAGNIDVVKALLEHCDSTMNLAPALTAASRAGHADVVSLLLDVHGIDPNAAEPALAVACLRGSPVIIKRFLNHPRINPNIPTIDGYTALAAACYRGLEEIVSWLLLTEGINVNAGKYHPLMVAVQAGWGRVVTQLIKSCVNIDVDQHAYNHNILKLHFSHSHYVDPHYSPIDREFREKECWLMGSAHMDSFPNNTLFDPGPFSCPDGLTPRQTGPYAVGLLNGPISRREAYAPIIRGSTFGEGDPILVYCVRVGNLGMSEAVLSHRGINMSAQARCGCTALIVGSILRRHTILDRILVRADTDPRISCPAHGTAILAAAHRLYFDTVDKIISSPLRSKLDFRDSIVSCGCNLFICAARSRDEDTFFSLIPLISDWQDSPNIADCKFGRTALLWASLYGQHSIVQLLLSNPNVDLNYKDKDGNTALILAAEGGFEEVVRALLAQSPGVKRNVRNRNGDTALSLAVWHGYKGIVRLLLARKDVDVSVLDRPGLKLWMSLYA
ncbi:hypothetical protein EST38_g11578 [Candolleomyces aberdarensis]|uniref:Ankyrin n=1 Tax=Candolleomyces aberdarensis TaxID=2316362 RepID=A0A4Q2D4I4_9AGAR|nr:hypothetical protein EST38_g11578 [Candolleomyces aberdarensis]